MKQFFLILSFALLLGQCRDTATQEGDRLQLAQEEKLEFLQQLLQERGIKPMELQLFLRAFKREQELEVWGKNASDTSHQLLLTYSFCKNSGQLGPKRREGDLQIPEGFYRVDRFNARSKFHLSLGLNYPNASDQKRSDPQRPGSDIFIHGGCASVGCISITDDKIKELYVLADLVHRYDQLPIQVHIFPTHLQPAQLDDLAVQFPEHVSFWQELQKGYLHFEKYKSIPEVGLRPDGAYLIK
ncbi:MAG: L,D-transpeptidase family protein [Bacteroidota bacterium]